VTDRPTLTEAQADHFWNRPADEICGRYELRDNDLDTAGIYNTATGQAWTGTRETIMEQWADITQENNDEYQVASGDSPHPDSRSVPTHVVAHLPHSKEPHMTTVPDALDRLHLLYKVATTTGYKNGRDKLHYIELADELHTTIRSITQGVEPEAAISGLVALWRIEAESIPNDRLASLNRSWANMAEHGTNPEGA